MGCSPRSSEIPAWICVGRVGIFGSESGCPIFSRSQDIVGGLEAMAQHRDCATRAFAQAENGQKLRRACVPQANLTEVDTYMDPLSCSGVQERV
jgi:hypothetical protein